MYVYIVHFASDNVSIKEFYYYTTYQYFIFKITYLIFKFNILWSKLSMCHNCDVIWQVR